MTCQIVQPQLPNNDGERQMFSFLKELPEDYTLFSELKINYGYEKQVKHLHLNYRQPDFVVVGSEIGIVSIEVKDWNLDRYIYKWKNQYVLDKLDARTGEIVSQGIGSPHAQVEAYKWGLRELINDLPNHIKRPKVTSVLAFPRLTRTAFLNGIQGTDLLTQKQAKFYLDANSILFKEDMDKYYRQPEKLLDRFVKKLNPSFPTIDGKSLYIINDLLIPTECKVGGNIEVQKARQKVYTLSTQQSEWAFSMDPNDNYLLDVAGSGKTNTLLSKAIHTVNKSNEMKPTILVTTYSPDLESSLIKIFRDKVGDESKRKYAGIKVYSIHSLVELIVKQSYSPEDIKSICEDAETIDERLSKLMEIANELIETDPNPDRFKLFDHIFIDEIQDFSNEYLRLIIKTSRGDSYFFVGDIGQKIYDRQYDLQRLGISFHRKALDKSFMMYRTPRFIAELATKFITNDPLMRAEFSEYGYSSKLIFANELDIGAELLLTSSPELDAAKKIKELLESQYLAGEDQILVVTSADGMDKSHSALSDMGIKCQRGEQLLGGAVTIVEYSESKGLEREVVLMLRVEDLYHSSNPDALLDSPKVQIDEDGYSRRKIYVALTRSTERLLCYYTERTHPLVRELCDINESINDKRISS
jgi:hypothetical protein